MTELTTSFLPTIKLHICHYQGSELRDDPDNIMSPKLRCNVRKVVGLGDTAEKATAMAMYRLGMLPLTQ